MNRDYVLSLVFEQSTDGLLLVEDGCFIDCNPAAVALLGYVDKSQIIGKRPADLSPEFQPDGARSAAREQEHFARALARGSVCFEWTHQRADGTPLFVEILLTAVTHAGRRILHLNWRDINRRHEAEKALEYRQSLEALVTGISSHFINLPAEHIDMGIHQALGALGAFVAADRSYVFAYQDGYMHNLYEWCASGIEPQIDRMQHVPVGAMAWSNRQILGGNILDMSSIDALPPAAQPEKTEFKAQGIQSVLVVPMERRGQVVGFIGFDAVRQRRDWPNEVVDLLRIAAGIIANVLDRRDAEYRLRQVNTQLEERVRERTTQLEQRRRVAEGLRDTLRVVNSNTSLEDTLLHVVRQAQELTGAAACTLYSMDRDTQTGRIEASVGIMDDPASHHLQFDLASTSGQELLKIVGQRGAMATAFKKSHLKHIRTDTNVPEEVRDRRVQVYERFYGSISAPLFVRDEAYGAILLYYDTPQDFTEQQTTIAMMMAEQAALAIENARVHQAEQNRRAEAEKRRRIAEGLREGLVVLNSNRALDDILDFVVQQAVQLLNTGGGAIYLLDDEREMLHVGASRGLDSTYATLEIPVGGAITGRAVALGEPVSVPDMRSASSLLETYLSAPNMPSGWIGGLERLRSRYNAVLAVPVKTRSQVYGAITLYYADAQHFSNEVIRLAVAFAVQAALVIENARLRQRVQATATIEERNRLARDLHDAVTQTLFSASMIADTLPELWRIDPADARQQLARLGQLTRGALAEMRTLLIELRPARIEEAEMHTLLQQLIDAAQGRSKVNIALNMHGQCDLPADVKIVFYRVAQEALNNIMKHAHAHHAFINMRCDETQVRLKIVDDGQGFDVHAIEAGHFGVQIMGERAASIGAAFVIDAQPDEGTEIQVIWSRK